MEVCRRARQDYRIPTVIARNDDPALLPPLSALEVQVVQPVLATVLALEGALRFLSAFALLQEQDDVTVGSAAVAGRPLRRVHMPGNVLALGVRRDCELIVPHGDTVLLHDNVLTLVGSADALREARQWLGGDGQFERE